MACHADFVVLSPHPGYTHMQIAKQLFTHACASVTPPPKPLHTHLGTHKRTHCAFHTHTQGGKSVEVRPVSVTKGMSTQRMVGLMAEVYGINGVTFDFVLCIGGFGLLEYVVARQSQHINL
eukprot:1091137-Pelagomonas_calceolata.AAC.4